MRLVVGILIACQSDSRKHRKGGMVAVALKQRAENSSLEINYYRSAVKVASS